MQENESKWANLSSYLHPNCICSPLLATTDALIIWQRRIKSQLVANVSRLPDGTSSEKSSRTQHTEKTAAHDNRCSESKTRLMDMATARQVEFGRCSGAPSRQKCSSFFYLQRRHDIPCPLKLATERCSPCSCCRHPSLAISSTAKRRAARNPIGLTGAVPNSIKWRHWARRVRGRESQRENHRKAGQRDRVEV